MNAPQTITINLVIGPDSPKPLRKAVARLLEQVATGDIADAQAPHTLADVWLIESEVHKFADATGQNRGMATKAVTSVRHGILHKADSTSQRGELLPAIFENRHGESKGLRADDFIAVIRSDTARQALRHQIDPFGPKAEEVAIRLADWLEDTYGKLDT